MDEQNQNILNLHIEAILRSLTKLEEQIDEMQQHLLDVKEVAHDIRKDVNDAFPDSDFYEHGQYHQDILRKKQEREELIRTLKKELVSKILIGVMPVAVYVIFDKVVVPYFPWISSWIKSLVG